jgi:hypothetical protein
MSEICSIMDIVQTKFCSNILFIYLFIDLFGLEQTPPGAITRCAASGEAIGYQEA